MYMVVISEVDVLSPPTRGAWIEITIEGFDALSPESPPTRGAWIEIKRFPKEERSARSPPTRGAWIEILMKSCLT